jgi:hypothetical protein
MLSTEANEAGEVAELYPDWPTDLETDVPLSQTACKNMNPLLISVFMVKLLQLTAELALQAHHRSLVHVIHISIS